MSAPNNYGTMLERGLRGEVDLYVTKSGSKERKGWGEGITLFFVETTPGGDPSNEFSKIVCRYGDLDPQGPILVEPDAIAVLAIRHREAIDAEDRLKTGEFNALVGVEILNER